VQLPTRRTSIRSLLPLTGGSRSHSALRMAQVLALRHSKSADVNRVTLGRIRRKLALLSISPPITFCASWTGT
jgi:hypothetical protein